MLLFVVSPILDCFYSVVLILSFCCVTVKTSNKKNFHCAFFLKYKRLKLKLRVFLAGPSVAMVTYGVTKVIPTCSPVIGQFF